MTRLTYPHSQGRKVFIPREYVARFNAIWPCSELRATRDYWFEFDRDGALIDSDVPQHDDGAAASAMADDCRAWLLDSKFVEWIDR